ncbi:MAG: hypothetical protein OS112_06920 [Methanoregula sp.]|nr:MAG: hypothetical protein OS112_06920 [Methanoregula sp.]
MKKNETVASRDFDLLRNNLYCKSLLNICELLMAFFSLSKEEADALYTAPKIIQSPQLVRWDNQRGKKQQLTITLSTEDGTPMRIRGWCYQNEETSHYGFALLFKNIVIRRWDDSTPHPNPKVDGKKIVIDEPHKHFHHPSYRDKCAYATIDIRLNDANGALIDFLNECNVDLKDFKFQPTLGLV